MDQENSEEDRPSIIQEIVFYDKPNIKTVVPKAIFPEKSALPLGKGDIIISRVRGSSSSHTSTKLHQDDKTTLPESNNYSVKEKRPAGNLDKHRNLENQPLSSLDSLNHFINYEHLEEEASEAVDIKQGASKSKSPAGTEKRTLKAFREQSDLVQSSESAENELEIIIINSDGTETHTTLKEASQSTTKGGKESTNATKKLIKEKEVSTGKLELRKTKKDSLGEKKSTTAALGKESPFKTPKKPVKKGEKKPQKVTMLNYLTKKPGSTEIMLDTVKGSSKKPTTKETTVKMVGKDKTPKRAEKLDEAQENTNTDIKHHPGKAREIKQTSSSPKKPGRPLKKRLGRPKKDSEGSPRNTSEDRPRKSPRVSPRKPSGGEKQAGEPENYYSDEDVSFRSPEKRKNYADLTNVPLEKNRHRVTNTDDLEELLDDAQEHAKALDRVEEDLQNMFGDKQGERKKQVSTGKRKAPVRKPKTPLLLVKKVKNELDEGEGTVEIEGESRDVLDTSVEDDYDSEDSRGEWLPEEYAEYRQQHLLRHQGKMYPCKFCGRQFSSYYGMRKHRALEHDDVGRDRKEGSYKESEKCKQEKEQDESDEESRDEWMPQDYADYKLKYKLNKLKRVQWYKCKICCAVFSNYYKLSKHRVEHENIPNPYECKQCDDRFKDVESLMAHIRVHQGKDPYQCRKCDKGFVTKEQLDEHIPVHILKKGPAPVKRFRCDICSKEFSKLCDIERHTRVHTGEKPSECNICHKRFQQSHNLSKHLLTHLHVKPFQCEICNKKFGRVDVLNRHLLTHSMDKPFKCQLCSKGFIRHVQLTNHVEKVHTSSDTDLLSTENEKNYETTEVIVSEDALEEVLEELVGM